MKRRRGTELLAGPGAAVEVSAPGPSEFMVRKECSHLLSHFTATLGNSTDHAPLYI